MFQIHAFLPAGGSVHCIPDAQAKSVVPAAIKACTPCSGNRTTYGSTLQYSAILMARRIDVARCVREVLTEAPPIVCALTDHARLVVAETIDVIFLQEEDCVVNQELPNFALQIAQTGPA